MRDIFMSVHERVASGAVWRKEEELIDKRRRRGVVECVVVLRSEIEKYWLLKFKWVIYIKMNGF